tara:strand:+ start:856 stop:1257 length:402 start_codon:yes stop_codon:yes gene_type:complete
MSETNENLTQFNMQICDFVRKSGHPKSCEISEHFKAMDKPRTTVTASISALVRRGHLKIITGDSVFRYEFVFMPGALRVIPPKPVKVLSGVIAAYRQPPVFTPRTADPFEAWRACVRDPVETSQAAVHSYKVG